jgi:hypothetical protein
VAAASDDRKRHQRDRVRGKPTASEGRIRMILTHSTVKLGMTGLEVFPIAFGSWELGGEWGQFDEDEGIAAIRRARSLRVRGTR